MKETGCAFKKPSIKQNMNAYLGQNHAGMCSRGMELPMLSLRVCKSEIFLPILFSVADSAEEQQPVLPSGDALAGPA